MLGALEAPDDVADAGGEGGVADLHPVAALHEHLLAGDGGNPAAAIACSAGRDSPLPVSWSARSFWPTAPPGKRGRYSQPLRLSITCRG